MVNTLNIKSINGQITGQEKKKVIIKKENQPHNKSIKNIKPDNWNKIIINNY